MELGKKTWCQVEEYLKEKQSLIIPIGSTEQHGPTALIGTDYMTADHIARKIGEKTKTLVAPPLGYGMANHHLAFPGSASLNPSTYIQVHLDLLDSWSGQGFKNFIYINGHGGNIATLNAAFSQFKRQSNDCKLALFSWWHLDQVLDYENKHFGKENGHHATCGEVSITQALFPEVFEKIESINYKVQESSHHWPLSPAEMKHFHPDGRMDSNPFLASKEHGEKLIEIAVEQISKNMEKLGYL